MAFIATAGEPDDEACHHQDSSPYEDADSQEVESQEVESSHKEDEGLYIPSYLEEAIPDAKLSGQIESHLLPHLPR